MLSVKPRGPKPSARCQRPSAGSGRPPPRRDPRRYGGHPHSHTGGRANGNARDRGRRLAERAAASPPRRPPVDTLLTGPQAAGSARPRWIPPAARLPSLSPASPLPHRGPRPACAGQRLGGRVAEPPFPAGPGRAGAGRGRGRERVWGTGGESGRAAGARDAPDHAGGGGGGGAGGGGVAGRTNSPPRGGENTVAHPLPPSPRAARVAKGTPPAPPPRVCESTERAGERRGRGDSPWGGWKRWGRGREKGGGRGRRARHTPLSPSPPSPRRGGVARSEEGGERRAAPPCSVTHAPGAGRRLLRGAGVSERAGGCRSGGDWEPSPEHGRGRSRCGGCRWCPPFAGSSSPQGTFCSGRRRCLPPVVVVVAVAATEAAAAAAAPLGGASRAGAGAAGAGFLSLLLQ